jgi:hypothetical protein
LVLGALLTVGLALATLFIPPVGQRPRLFRVALAVGVAAGLWPLEPDRLVQLRWRHTLSHGHPAVRAEAARHLARGGYRDLRGADLSLTNLAGADLNRVSFIDANLSKANLSGAFLQEARMAGANVSEANLSRADLHGSDIFEAKGWLQTQCSSATEMPTLWQCIGGRPALKLSAASR